MKGIRVKKGSAQDATFITSDPGHVKHEEPREEGKTRRSKDGSFTKKNNKTFFGYKCHTITADNHPVPFVRSYAVTTAKDHDTRIDLSKWESLCTGTRDILAVIPRELMAQWTEL